MRAPFCNLCCRSFLLLTILVTLVEFVNAAGGVNELDFTGIEGVRCVGNLNLYNRIFNTVNNQSFLCGCAGTGYEYCVVGHILESYKTVGFGMNSFLHFT